MKCKKEFEYDKAIIVDSDMLTQFNEEIGKLCDSIKYEAELINGDELEFDSFDELVKYENSKDNYLKKITISARDRKQYVNDVRVYIEQSNYDSPRFYRTVRVIICTDNIDEITVFQKRIEHLCGRHSQEKVFQFFSKTGIFRKLLYACYGIYIGYFPSILFNKKDINLGMALFMFILLIYIFLEKPIEKARKKYYPPIIYYIGDGIKNYDGQKDSRNSFFWTVCVGGGLTIIVGIIGIIFSII